MPDWLAQVLLQYPIVVVVGLVAWYAYREIKAEAAEHKQYVRELHASAKADQAAANREAVAAMRAEADRTRTEVLGELKTLTKKVDALTRRLGG